MVTSPEATKDADADAPHGVGLGLRWSFLDEVLNGRVPPSIRFFEVSPENYMRRGGFYPQALTEVAQRYRVLTHGLMLNIGSTAPLDKEYLSTLRRFLERMGAKTHSDHLCWNGTDGHILHDLLPLSARPATIDHVVDRVKQVQDALGMPLALENISYYMLPGSTIPEAEMISAVLDRADCDLLLDVNNVWVNARNHGFDPFEYMSSLPLERVVHMHVAGGERLDNFDNLVIDTHGTDVSSKVADLMAWVIERVGPRPVLYERDHDIPPLSVLGQQVEVLNERYDAALARWEAARPAARAPQVQDLRTRGPAHRPVKAALESSLLGDLERGLSAMILHREPPSTSLKPVVAPLQRAAREALEAVPPARHDVYRKLVRNGISSTIYGFMPRTRARRGVADFDDDIGRWLGEEGPHSPYIRDLPSEFSAWISARWRLDASVPEYLVEVGRYELMEMRVKAEPDAARRSDSPPPLSLDAVLDFHGSACLGEFSHKVQLLPRSKDDTQAPARDDTRLLGYRDEFHDVRFLELSRLAYEVVLDLLDGVCFGEAVQAGTARAGENVSDDTLARVGVVISDMVDRGIILGVRPPPSADSS